MNALTVENIFPTFEKELQDELLACGEIRHFKAGEPLMRAGQYFRSAMLILDGLVKVYREGEEGNEYFMYYLHPGQACALSMVCATRQQTSEVTAKAVKESDIIIIPLRYMDEWMARYKSWYHFVLENYRSRFEELLVTLDHVAFRAMDERLEFYLKEHRKAMQSDMLGLSHQEIAEELNSSREVISRLLKKMEQRGKLKLHRNAIELTDL